MAESTDPEDNKDKRKDTRDRRAVRQDRRDQDRIAEDRMPRRDPDKKGRRADDRKG